MSSCLVNKHIQSAILHSNTSNWSCVHPFPLFCAGWPLTFTPCEKEFMTEWGWSPNWSMPAKWQKWKPQLRPSVWFHTKISSSTYWLYRGTGVYILHRNAYVCTVQYIIYLYIHLVASNVWDVTSIVLFLMSDISFGSIQVSHLSSHLLEK